MERRDFLKEGLSGLKSLIKEKNESPKIQGNLDKFEGTLSRSQAMHLLRRVSFAPTPATVDAITGKSPQDALAYIFGTGDVPLPEGRVEMNWLDTPEEDPLSGLPQEIRSEIEGKHRARYNKLKEWWLRLMRDEEPPFMEKMTLFLSTIWTIEFTYDTNAYIPPPLLYRNNQTLRQNRLGDYKTIAGEITLDGAMLLYQSLHYSTGDAPNENYARELLELFTMGIGNYTEGDIRESSRALTGWQVYAYKFQQAPSGKLFQAFFSPNRHDTGSKNFILSTIKSRDEAENTEFKVKEEEVYGILDIMFEKRPYEIANFVCEKIYKYFVYSSPADVDETVISEMSDVFVSSGFNLRSVFEALFTSKHFYSDEVIGSQFKTPPEFIAGFQRQLSMEYKTGNFEKHREAVDNLEQMLYDPPNVGSWIGYRTWISTTTYPLRVHYALEMLGMTEDSKLIDLAKSMPSYENATELTAALLQYLLPKEISSERKSNYKSIMLQGINEGDWASEINSSSSLAATGIRKMIERLIYAPDFQLN